MDTGARDNLWSLFEAIGSLPEAETTSVLGVATVPDVRGQGIGAAITLAPYCDAMESGWERAVIFATDLGAPVYRRIGFTDTGSAISRYLWARP